MFPYITEQKHEIGITSSDFLSEKYFVKTNVPMGVCHFMQAFLKSFPVTFTETSFSLFIYLLILREFGLFYFYLFFFSQNNTSNNKKAAWATEVGKEILVHMDMTCI